MLRLLLPAYVRVETALAPTPVAIHADRAQLDQVLINLAFNARDAMPAGGTIRLATGSRELDAGDGPRLIGVPIPPGHYALLSVTATGHGMDPATLAHVFEAFFTTKPLGSGTGLGLATVYGIVKQSGGFVFGSRASLAGEPRSPSRYPGSIVRLHRRRRLIQPSVTLSYEGVRLSW